MMVTLITLLSKVNQEEKDNKKYEYLRGQAISRNLSLQETRQNEEIKEKNKIVSMRNTQF